MITYIMLSQRNAIQFQSEMKKQKASFPIPDKNKSISIPFLISLKIIFIALGI
jgi:hypothetical protein